MIGRALPFRLTIISIAIAAVLAGANANANARASDLVLCGDGFVIVHLQRTDSSTEQISVEATPKKNLHESWFLTVYPRANSASIYHVCHKTESTQHCLK